MEHTYAQCKETCVGYRHSGEDPLLVKRASQAVKDIKNGSAWLDMRQAQDIRMKRNVRGSDIKLNKAGKAHENAFTT